MSQSSLGRYYSGYFKMPRLKRRDLAEIEGVILKDLRPERCRVACRGRIYERVEDMPPEMHSTVTLVLYTHSPSLRLKFARSWAELYCEDMTEAMAPAVKKVNAIVKRCERRPLWRFAKLSSWMAPMVGFGVLCEVVILVYYGRLDRSLLRLGVGLLLISAVWWVLGYRAALFRFCRLDLGKE